MSAADTLESLLALDPDQVIARQRSLWTRAAGARAANVVLFGAGRLGVYTVRGLAKAGARPIVFADNAERLWGTTVEGIAVISPHEAVQRHGDNAAFVVTTYNTVRPRRQLAELGARTIVPFAWLFAHYPDALLPHGALEHPRPVFEQADDVRRGFALMATGRDRDAFVAQLRARLFLDFDCDAAQTAEMRDSEYFPRDLYRYLPDEVVVDCGAFDGDSLRRFMGVRGDAFRAAYLCEPDPSNRARLNTWIASLPEATRRKLRVEPVAVGAARMKTTFDATGTAGSGVSAAGAYEVDLAPIDEFTREPAPTMIKMDVEGAELEAIEGARHTIAGSTPVLAVCVYHQSDHLWKVPLAIAALSNRYRLHVRAHAEDCWDACCYAVPEERDISAA